MITGFRPHPKNYHELLYRTVALEPVVILALSMIWYPSLRSLLHPSGLGRSAEGK